MSGGETIHAGCVAIGGRGVLLAGRSGSGKSDLALRLIDRGATLVSDDYTRLRVTDAGLLASAPATIAERLEVRGVGIVAMNHLDDVPIALLVLLDEPPERLPRPETRLLLDIALPLVRLAAAEASAALKVELALSQLGAPIEPGGSVTFAGPAA